MRSLVSTAGTFLKGTLLSAWQGLCGFEHLQIFDNIILPQPECPTLHTFTHTQKRTWSLCYVSTGVFYHPMKWSVWSPKRSSAQLEVLTSACATPPP